MYRFIRFVMLDTKLLAKSKVFYLKLILLPLALILLLGSLFDHSASFSSTASSREAVHVQKTDLRIPKEVIASGTRPVSAMQYEVAAMTVLFSFLTAFELAHSLVNDKLNHTMARIRSTPTLMLQYCMGKLLGMTLAIAVQMTAVMLGSRLLFHVNWVNSPSILLVTCVYGLALGSLVLCCGLLANNQAAISSFAGPILYGLGFLGGSFFDKDHFPPILKAIQAVTPNGKAINAYLHIFQGGSLTDISSDILMLAGAVAVFFIAALLLAGRKGQ